MTEVATDEIGARARWSAEFFAFVRVAALGFVAVLLYGVLRDLVCAFVSPAYFTVAHVPPYGVRARIPMALIWGTQSTWMMGVVIGVACACAARLGAWPKFTVRELAPHAFGSALVFAVAALVLDLVVYAGAATSLTRLAEPWASRIPLEEHARFLYVDAVHDDDAGPRIIHALIFSWVLVLGRGRRARDGG